jgi:hypothetical protein
MKTFNKTLIAAATITTFGLAAAPTALALDASASVATSYLWRGLDLGSGTPALSADVSGSTGGFSYGLWVSSGDTGAGTEYDLYASYGGEIGGLSYSLGRAQYNYPTNDADAAADGFQAAELEDNIYSLSYAGVTATVYDAVDSDFDAAYNTLSFDLGPVGVLLGDHDNQLDDGTGEMSHVDLTYSVNDSLSFTVSTIISSSFPADETDTTVVASYTLPF